METAGVKTSPEVTTPHLLGGVDVSGWPTASRKAATEMLGTYGPPQEVTDHLLIWRYNSPWKRTVVYRLGARHDFPSLHQDVLAQTIEYPVPADLIADLIAFNAGLIVDQTARELTVHCNSERLNTAILNLAHDIVIGHQTPEGAREALKRIGTVLRLRWPHQYTTELHFGTFGDYM